VTNLGACRETFRWRLARSLPEALNYDTAGLREAGLSVAWGGARERFELLARALQALLTGRLEMLDKETAPRSLRWGRRAADTRDRARAQGERNSGQGRAARGRG